MRVEEFARDALRYANRPLDMSSNRNTLQAINTGTKVVYALLNVARMTERDSKSVATQCGDLWWYVAVLAHINGIGLPRLFNDAATTRHQYLGLDMPTMLLKALGELALCEDERGDGPRQAKILKEIAVCLIFSHQLHGYKWDAQMQLVLNKLEKGQRGCR